MFHIVLYEPEIPPNTGNIIRLCANTGNQLHLIKPLGFDLDEKKLRRAGLDYEEFTRIRVYDSFSEFTRTCPQAKIYAVSTRGTCMYHETQFQRGDVLVFGPETRGLPQALLDELPAEQILRIPMQDNSRSLNLSNAAAVILYEAWRQQGFSTGSE